MRYYASAGLKTLSFFLILPIAAHLLPKEEVGRFFFWLAIIQLGAGITTLGFSSTVARKAYNAAITDYTAGLGVLIALTLWLLVSILGLATGLMSVAVAIAWIARSASMLGESRTVAHNRIGRLSAVYVIYAVVFPVSCALLAAYVSATHVSLLLAYALAEGIVAFAGLGRLRLRRRADARTAMTRLRDVSRRSAQYGLPIMIAGIANLGLNSADRFIVTGFHGFDAVADFSIMYTIAFASNRFITAPANLRLFPAYVRGRFDAAAVSRVNDTASLAWLASVAYCVAIVVLGPWLIPRILGEAYALRSADLALVSVASAMFLLFTINTVHLKVRNKTSHIMFLLFIALLINMSMSLLLVPRLGYHGASISTCIAYTALAAWALFRLRPSLVRIKAIVGGVAVLAVLFTWAFTR